LFGHGCGTTGLVMYGIMYGLGQKAGGINMTEFWEGFLIGFFSLFISLLFILPDWGCSYLWW